MRYYIEYENETFHGNKMRHGLEVENETERDEILKKIELSGYRLTMLNYADSEYGVNAE